jgi:hypothetical protein
MSGAVEYRGFRITTQAISGDWAEAIGRPGWTYLATSGSGRLRGSFANVSPEAAVDEAEGVIDGILDKGWNAWTYEAGDLVRYDGTEATVLAVTVNPIGREQLLTLEFAGGRREDVRSKVFAPLAPAGHAENGAAR